MQLQKLPSIWVDSGSTIGYVSNGATIDKSKRFQYNSIYYKDDPTKPKKKIDELLFPHQILNDFRKCIRDASKSKSKEKNKPKRPYSLDEDQEQKSFISSKASSVTKRLYQKPEILPGKRDFFGNRCALNQNKLNHICHLPSFLNKSLTKNDSTQKLYVSASQRLDLSRPINFNPGPGSYLIDYHNEAKSKLAQSYNGQSGVLKRKRRERTLLESISNER